MDKARDVIRGLINDFDVLINDLKNYQGNIVVTDPFFIKYNDLLNQSVAAIQILFPKEEKVPESFHENGKFKEIELTKPGIKAKLEGRIQYLKRLIEISEASSEVIVD